VRIPSFPFGGAIFPGFSMQLLIPQDLQTMTHAAVSHPLPKQTSNDERRAGDLQIGAEYSARKRYGSSLSKREQQLETKRADTVASPANQFMLEGHGGPKPLACNTLVALNHRQEKFLQSFAIADR
jgi:hypothetical protein